MNYNSLTSGLSRIFTFGAVALIALAVIEYTANVFGYTVMHETRRPGRLIELAAALAVIVIALLLRQIREELRKKA
jgi:hypothetical protein